MKTFFRRKKINDFWQARRILYLLADITDCADSFHKNLLNLQNLCEVLKDILFNFITDKIPVTYSKIFFIIICVFVIQTIKTLLFKKKNN
ncbi:hypothetical protein C1638_002735 [Chryseobacterium oncorhynchi]|uniref:Uncharacterized protein n=1 Tax=Chryseobacterium oncorhynchi TaxID=741074 RepID=A0A316X1G6_9FLAO|nr:hypothetical protein C1638_002735 [Chryseobacterium oncorhynchi]